MTGRAHIVCRVLISGIQKRSSSLFRNEAERRRKRRGLASQRHLMIITTTPSPKASTIHHNIACEWLHVQYDICNQRRFYSPVHLQMYAYKPYRRVRRILSNFYSRRNMITLRGGSLSSKVFVFTRPTDHGSRSGLALNLHIALGVLHSEQIKSADMSRVSKKAQLGEGLLRIWCS